MQLKIASENHQKRKEQKRRKKQGNQKYVPLFFCKNLTTIYINQKLSKSIFIYNLYLQS